LQLAFEASTIFLRKPTLTSTIHSSTPTSLSHGPAGGLLVDSFPSCCPFVLNHAAGNTIQNSFALKDSGGLTALNESECYTQEVLEDTEESEEYGRGKGSPLTRHQISNK
jgi:hypothetical protein